MKKYLILLLLLSITISCKKSKNYKAEINKTENLGQKFESKTFSFNYPDDWKITDKEEIEQGTYYLSIEKKGLDSSGLITILSFEELMDLDELIKMNKIELENNPIFNNLKFELIVDNRLNSIKTRSSIFRLSVLGIKHEGLVSAFKSNKNSYLILKQGALEDKEKNIKGFKIIENSFKIN